MTMATSFKERFSAMRRGFVAFARDRRAVAAVEFALIAPVLMALYFITMEVSQAIETNKKVSRVGSMVADLVTQQPSEMSKAELEAILQIGSAILQPYNRSQPAITVTGIYITDESNPKVRVAWSRRLNNGSFSQPFVKNSITTVPEDLKIRDTFLIRVSSEMDYRPVITWKAEQWTSEQKSSMGLAAAFDSIDMAEAYYLRPRMTNKIECKGC